MVDIANYIFKITSGRYPKKQGTAFLIAPKIALTAKHVLKSPRILNVYLEKNNKKIKARVRHFENNVDAVILDLENEYNTAGVEFPILNTLFQPKNKDHYWESYGFPKGYQKDLNGDSLRKTSETFKWDIDISIDPPLGDYGGVSGSPVIVNKKVIGLIISDVPNHQLGVLSLKKINSLKELDSITKTLSKKKKPIQKNKVSQNRESQDWNIIIDKSLTNKYYLLNTSVFEEYLLKYPNGKHSAEAKIQIEKSNKWFEALEKNDINSFQNTIPDSKFTEEDFNNRFYFLALKNIWIHGDTDIFPYPFENRVFRDRTEEVIKVLSNLNDQFSASIKLESEGGLKFDLPDKNLIETALPTGHTGFRWVTQIEPIWNAYFLSLVLKISHEVEDRRKYASFSSRIHSYRFDPDYKNGHLFKRRIGYQFWDKTEKYLIDNKIKTDKINFDHFKNKIFNNVTEYKKVLYSSLKLSKNQLKEVLSLSKIKISDWFQFQVSSYELVKNNSKYKFVVSSDIADFYNRLNHIHIRDSLYAYKNVKHELSNIIELFSQKKSHGLPIGGNASRIIAENVLYDFDEYLYDNGINFSRFVDDYYFFTETEDEANKHLNKFYTYLLNEKGLSLQKHKIQIFTRNEFLNSIETRLFWKSDDKKVEDKARTMALARFDYYAEEANIDKTDENEHSINIERLLNEELRKSRIHEQLATRLLQELGRKSNKNVDHVEFNKAISKAFYSIFHMRTDRPEKDKILKLYPIFRKLLLSLKTNIQQGRLITLKKESSKSEHSINTLDLVLKRLLSLYESESYIFDIYLHKTYWFYLLSKLPSSLYSKKYTLSDDKSIIIKDYFKRELAKTPNNFVRSWLLINLLLANETGQFKREFEKYDSMEYWEKRIYIIGAVLIGHLDETKIKLEKLNGFEKILFSWAKEIGSIKEFKEIL